MVAICGDADLACAARHLLDCDGVVGDRILCGSRRVRLRAAVSAAGSKLSVYVHAGYCGRLVGRTVAGGPTATWFGNELLVRPSRLRVRRPWPFLATLSLSRTRALVGVDGSTHAPRITECRPGT